VHVRQLLLRGKVAHDRYKEEEEEEEEELVVVVVMDNFCNPPVNITKKNKAKVSQKGCNEDEIRNLSLWNKHRYYDNDERFQLQLISVKLL